MIDCHAHLADSLFASDLDDVILRAKDAGVVACVVVPEAMADFVKVLEICSRHEGFLFPCLGIHPAQNIKSDTEEGVKVIGTRSVDSDKDSLDEALKLMKDHHEKIVGVGEVGLDFTPRICSHGDADKAAQREALRKQVEFSTRFQLPLNVHSRSAGKPTLALLKESGAKNVVMHAFDGNPKSARVGLEAGFFFSIPPSIVRSEQKDKLVQIVPLHQLLLESDSPALGPVKDERNEPKNIQISCEYIAKIKGVDVDAVAKATTENALRLFPKLKAFLHL